MKINRTRNAIHGTTFGIILKMIQILSTFVIRTIIIKALGAEYAGLNSLFSAILKVLNLAELGVGSAMVFSMYRPIAEDDTDKICQLLNLYRKYYRIIGSVILIIGVLIEPFLPHLIKGSVPSDINLYVIYALHLSATVFTYWFFAYRTALFTAHQRNDIISIVSIVTYVCLYCLQVVALLYFRSYYLYLCLSVFAQIVINLITALYSKLVFPNYNPRGTVPEKERRDINNKVRDLFTAKIGSVINNSADSVVISALLGLELLAIYQNYYYIIFSIMTFINIFLSSCTAGIGNSLIVNDDNQNKRIFYNVNHILFLAINCCCACFLAVCQSFMQLWMGEEYELSFYFVVLFVLYLFIEEAPRTLICFKDAGGIWKHDRFRPLICSAVNLVLNLMLTPVIGLYGVILSTIFALAFVAYPWLIININNRLFKIDIKKYVLRLFFYMVTIAVSCFLSYWISNMIVMEKLIYTIMIRLVTSMIISSTVFYVAFRCTSENKYLMHQMMVIFKKMLHLNCIA